MAWLILALAAIVVGAVLLWRLPRGVVPPAAGTGEGAWTGQGAPGREGVAMTRGDEALEARPLHQAPPGGAAAPGEDPTPDLADYVPKGQAPTMAEVIDRLHAAGIRTGLGAFDPPGTSPPLVGLAVPDDFVLPEGYVRHYQATDDGQRIEPILMYSPDYRFFDRDGRPVAIPANRVVPPDRAPPGLPLRQVTLPPPMAQRGH